MFDLTGKKIIVTGAASGIGKEISHLLSRHGANCFRFDSNKDGLLEDNLSQEEHPAYAFDLTDFELMKKIFTEMKNKSNGGFDGFVHCAGIPSITPLRILTNEEYERVQKINTQAGLNLAKIFSKSGFYNSQAQTCSIVFISSVYALVGSAANVAYAVSKAANIGMTKALAVELAPKKIRVNCIVPGFIKTEMSDKVPMFDEKYSDRIEKMHLLGWGTAEDVANGAMYLLSDAAKWITGSVLTIDGGFTAQ